MPGKAVVVHESEPPVEGWAPERGAVTWRTLFSGERTASDSITQGVAEVLDEGNDVVRLHQHAHAETYYVLSGCGRLTVGGEEHELAPGVAAFIPGGTWHGARAIGPEPLRILYTFAADAFGDVVYEFPDPD